MRMAIPSCPKHRGAGSWKVKESPATLTLATAKLQVIVDRQTGAVSFADANGHPILSETSGSRTLEPATVQGEDTFHVQQRWKSQAGESLYGLGQMQLGITDIRSEERRGRQNSKYQL